MYRKFIAMIAFILIVFLASAGLGQAQEGALEPIAALGTAFTYQGRLSQGSSPANGAFDLEFYLFESPSGGAPLGGPIAFNDLNITDGYFTVPLDFGLSAFNGQARYLEVRVRPGSDTGSFATLAPRQELTAAPYALHAADAWSLAGNSGTNPASQYLGTRDNTALELRVNGLRALRLEPNANGPNLIGGYSGNTVTSGVYGATLFGGGLYSSTSYPNRVTDHFGTISGGMGNQAGNNNLILDDAWYATVGGGNGNLASNYFATVSGGNNNRASGNRAAIGGGDSNQASDNYATISGGYNNQASGSSATVGGGNSNQASFYATIGGGVINLASGFYDTVGGGYNNQASGSSATIGGGNYNRASNNYATVCGGDHNQASNANSTVGGGGYNQASGPVSSIGGGDNNQASGQYATVGGGSSNQASGQYATVGGGYQNKAEGNYSFAIGRRAVVTSGGYGSFVFSDSKDFDTISSVPNQFVARATGGVFFGTAIDASGNFLAGVGLPSGSSQWYQLSDRTMKMAFKPINVGEILARVAGLPIQTWSYKAQSADIRHIGPMAQDFYAAFGLGEDARYIGTLDADGVALAAIQGLYQRSQQQAQEIQALKAKLSQAGGPGNAAAPALPWPWIGACGFLGLLVLGQTAMFLSLRKKLGGGS